ncbi:MAG: hypothetical protein BM564_08455 [Bacteroidetes bacterium MedPE-SWsnd-G2]|nr:MAG: hypothetical protein BM564_08455 [Bacteroidetes bacterium MedPE-SWsnd-G2]
MKYFLIPFFMCCLTLGYGQTTHNKSQNKPEFTEMSVIISVDNIEDVESIDIENWEEVLKDLGDDVPVEIGINCNKKTEESKSDSNFKMSFKGNSSNSELILKQLNQLKTLALKFYKNQ